MRQHHVIKNDLYGRIALRLDQIAAIEMDSGKQATVHLQGGQTLKVAYRNGDTEGLWSGWLTFLGHADASPAAAGTTPAADLEPLLRAFKAGENTRVPVSQISAFLEALKRDPDLRKDRLVGLSLDQGGHR